MSKGKSKIVSTCSAAVVYIIYVRRATLMGLRSLGFFFEFVPMRKVTPRKRIFRVLLLFVVVCVCGSNDSV